ncbi:MAG: type II secretion system F family protein [Acidobacteriaceae bacterium]|nr:type II secretion system F family protein [Acidobacteriaceae bacterium]
MPLIFFILLFVVLVSAITAFGYVQFAKPANMLDQLETSTSTEIAFPQKGALEAKSASGMAKLLESVGRLLPYSPRDIGAMKRQLGAAGFRSAYVAYSYLGIKLFACAFLLLPTLLLRDHLTANPLNRLIFPIGAALAGFLGPGFVLGQLVKKRQEKIRLALPDVLDMLVISTEAGCALDKAMINVAREFKTFHPVISEELRLVNMEMLAGGSRVEALRNFALRTGEEELKKLVAILIQTDRFGTSVAEALRTQSEFMRVRRRQMAEERAGKVGVKLVFPIFFFCMPSLTLIVAGPGMMQLFKSLPAITSMS